jgi:hypothetical protein
MVDKEKDKVNVENFAQNFEKLTVPQKKEISTLFLAHFNEEYEDHKNRISLMEGIVLGLIFGIFGNLAVQYSYPLLLWLSGETAIQALMPSSLIFIISLIVIAITILFYRRRIKSEKEELTGAFANKMAAEDIMHKLEETGEDK